VQCMHQHVTTPHILDSMCKALQLQKILYSWRHREWWVVLFSIIWHMITTEIWLGCSELFFFFPFSFFFHALEIIVNHFKKQLYYHICNFINLGLYFLLLFILFFYTFWSLASFFFNFIFGYFISFDFCI